MKLLVERIYKLSIVYLQIIYGPFVELPIEQMYGPCMELTIGLCMGHV